MAQLPPNKPWGQLPLGFDENDVNVQTLAIGGKMVTVRMDIGDDAYVVHGDDEAWRRHMRDQLAHRLATFILESGLCETTMMSSPDQMKRVVAIRCYLAPGDQVKLLRVHGQ